jgi:homospermidine synthase
VFYVNASIEEWDPYSGLRTSTSLEKSLYRRYVQMLDLIGKWKGSPTAVLDHGMNPGIISAIAKKGLLNLAAYALRKNHRLSRRQKRLVEESAEEQKWPQLSMHLGIRAIHCSERDTQVASVAKRANEFAGVWSIEAMTEECIAPVEVGWGTHEKQMPAGATVPDIGPQNQIVWPQMGMNTWVRSWVPHEEFVGMVITHGEAFTLSHLLTVRSRKRVMYRPTVLYVYLPANETIASLHEFRCRGYDHRFRKRIMKDELEKGADSVGILLMGHPYNSWWTGSVLSIRQARRLVPHQNATTIQVAIGVVAGVVWALENPDKGVCLPEDLPHEHVLRTARPYLGDFVSMPTDWTPLTNYRIFFLDGPANQPDRQDAWQFGNFLFKP